MEKMYLGTMGRNDVNNLTQLIREAVKHNYWGIDSAAIYGNEEITGEAMRILREENIVPRIQTKIWTSDFTRAREAFKEMLAKLQLDKVDSLLLHRPSINFNESIDAWKVLIELKKEGKVDRIGVSNFDYDMIKILENKTGVIPEINQIEMSLTNFRHDRLYKNNKMNIEVQGWSALGKNTKQLLENPILQEVAKKHDLEPSQAAISFLTTQGIIPIIGTSKPERILMNSKTIKLSNEDIIKLNEINEYDSKFEETYPY